MTTLRMLYEDRKTGHRHLLVARLGKGVTPHYAVKQFRQITGLRLIRYEVQK